MKDEDATTAFNDEEIDQVASVAEPLTRRTYLLLKAMEAGANFLLAVEAVSSTALEHPEWDMAERRTWADWEQD